MNTVTIAIVLLILTVLGMTVYFVYAGQAKRRKRLLNIVQGGATQEKKGARSANQRRADLARKLKETHEDGEEDVKKDNLSHKIMMAGLFNVTMTQFWIVSAFSGLGLALVAYIVNGSPLVTAAGFITGLFGLPRFVLNIMINHRQKKFMDDLADALESMQRLLKAGMPVSECIKMVAREFTGPVGEEMGRIFDQQKIGVPLPEATLEAARRMPIAEMQMFATAIAIQTQTGSSLSEVLENLAGVIRARFRLKRKVKALSSEAKASAAIIGSLPILVGVGMYFLNNAYVMVLLTEGKFLVGVAVGWMMVGILVMRQMINFKV